MQILPANSRFGRILADRRERFNALFAQMRHMHPNLDAAAFGQWLVERVHPILQKAGDHPNAPELSESLYMLSLECVARDLAGTHARGPVAALLFGEVLPNLTPALCADPIDLPTQLFNALFQLHQFNADTDRWCLSLVDQAAQLHQPQVLRLYAQCLAWRCGMAHFRVSLLEGAHNLPLPLAAALFDLELPPSQQQWQTYLVKAAENPWFHPKTSTQELRFVGTFEGFTGFGGHFSAPPRVAYCEDHWLATDGQNCYQIYADTFGTTVHKTTQSFPKKPQHLPAAWTVEAKSGGNIQHAGLTVKPPHFQNVSSYDWDQNTLMYTLEQSHAIFIIACTAP